MLRNLLLGSAALLISGSAFAADLPSRKAPAVAYAAPIFTWTGFYVGVEGGLDFIKTRGSFTTTLQTTGSYSTNKTAGLLGGLVGYNYQIGQLVVGLEGNLDAVLGGKKSSTFLDSGLNLITASTRTTYAGDIRGRLGYAFDRALLFIDGGVAFGDAKTSLTGAPGLGLTAVSLNTRNVGYTLGAGIDYAFTNEWIGRAEYRYSNFGSKSYATAAVRTFNNASVKSDSSAVLVGLIYKFGAPATVVAKY